MTPTLSIEIPTSVKLGFATVLFVAFATNTSADDAATAGAIKQVLTRQAEAWNRGDIESFMQAYWHDDRLTFSSGGQTQRGWDNTRTRYLTRYPTRDAMGKLTFSDLETTVLGNDAALTLGRWHLERDQPIGGNFSLVWRKIDGAWLIIHDHTSADTHRKHLSRSSH